MKIDSPCNATPTSTVSQHTGAPFDMPRLRRETRGRAEPRCLRPAWIILLLTLIFSLHLAAQPMFPSTPNPPLDSWSFSDIKYWTSDYGYNPISFTNLAILTSNGPGNSLLIDATNESQLLFSTWNSDGTTNLNLTSDGSLMFWLNPDWSSTNEGGIGPGGLWSPVIDLGAYTSNATYGWWSCGFNSAGTNFYFFTQDAAGHEGSYIYAPVELTNGNWNLIALTWSSTNTIFYFNGALVTNGPGVSVLPSLSVMSNGFAIGSDAATGLLQMHGAMNHLTTYNYQLTGSMVDAEWVLNGVFYFGSDATIPYIAQPQSTPSDSPTYDVISGPGYLLAVSTNTSGCTNSSNVWITNVTSAVSNGAINLTFEIFGGSNGWPYDVFATPALTSPLTNGIWTWMGQGYPCVTYTIPGLTNSDVFLLLGTPQDSENCGLTDAYQLLVSKTNPLDPWTVAGIPDAWCVLNGLNANDSNLANEDPDEDGLSNLQEYLYGTNPQVSQGFAVWVANPAGTSGIP
jgi:hypothetical protein